MRIGQTVPDHVLQAFHRDRITPIRLADYRGRWLVLIFYPGDFTFICPTELYEAGELFPEFQKLGAEVVGISTDSVYVHKAWHDASPRIKAIAFPLAADPSGRLSREFRRLP